MFRDRREVSTITQTASDEDACADHVAQLRLDGITHAELTSAYFAEAARMLGTWWEDDRISFFQTTMGTGRLIGLLRALQPEQPRIFAGHGRHALFATVPDAGHTIGIAIAADLFRRDGWDIDVRMGPTPPNWSRPSPKTPPPSSVCAPAPKAPCSRWRKVSQPCPDCPVGLTA